MTHIEFRGVSKQYHKKENIFSRSDLFLALNDLSFSVSDGESVGIIGPNGAGKTTVMGLVSRIVHPTRGRVFVRGRVVPLIALDGCLHPVLNARENISFLLSLYHVKSADKKRLLPSIVDFSSLSDFLEMPVKNFSSGMCSRLAFSVAAHLPGDILLVDEVLAVGDAEFQKKCLEKIAQLKKEGRTLLFVSHQMSEVRRVCDRVLWIDHGRLVLEGAAADVIQAYEKS